MRLTELLMQTITGFVSGRIGRTTLIYFGSDITNDPVGWLKAHGYEQILQSINRSNPHADDWVD